MNNEVETLPMHRSITRPLILAVFAMALYASAPLMAHGAAKTPVVSGSHQSDAAAPQQTKRKPAAKSPAYRNNQLLNRVVIKVQPHQKGAFYVALKPQNPTPGPTLLAMPNLTLEKLLALAKTHRELVVSGRVHLYNGKSYLMLAPNIYQPRQFGMHVGVEMEKISRRRASKENAAAILKKLLSHSISAPASEHITIHPAARVRLPLQNMNAPNDATAPALAEGTYIWNRMGHLQYDPVLGQWVFVFLSDGRRAPDPPIIILPSAKLAEMRALGLQQHSRAILRISGIVTEFKDRNFLMPTYVQLYHNLGRF
jgi:hypothetical protein